MFEIIEIERIIFSYLDYIVDFGTLKQVSKKYPRIANNNNVRSKLNQIRDLNFQIIDDYIFRINLHDHTKYTFRWSCHNRHLNGAQWLWNLDNKINLHAVNKHAFHYSCLNGYGD